MSAPSTCEKRRNGPATDRTPAMADRDNDPACDSRPIPGRGLNRERRSRSRAVVLTTLLLFAPFPVAATSLVQGGYSETVTLGASPGLQPLAGVRLHDDPGSGGLQRGGAAFGLGSDGAFMSYFTPRLGGVRVDLGRTHSLAPLALSGETRGREQFGLGMDYRLGFDGFEIGLAGRGGVEITPHDHDMLTSLRVGGMLRIDDLGYGPMQARLTYGVEGRASGAAVSSLSLSADLTLRPGLALTGEVALDDEQDRTSSSTRGLLGLRLLF